MIGYPKTVRRRIRQRHKKSILQSRKECYLCRILGETGDSALEEHHVFGGSRRKISEAEGLKVYLCSEHHRTGPEAVHRSRKTREILQRDAQRAYMETHAYEEWMRMMGKNYLEGRE